MLTTLLVEDEVLVRYVAEEDLGEMGCSVFTASTGDEALARLEAGERFDLLVTDIRMPGAVDGWELARRARQVLPSIGVIYVSGYAGEHHDPVESSQFLKKPYRLEQLREALTIVARS